MGELGSEARVQAEGIINVHDIRAVVGEKRGGRVGVRVGAVVGGGSLAGGHQRGGRGVGRR